MGPPNNGGAGGRGGGGGETKSEAIHEELWDLRFRFLGIEFQRRVHGGAESYQQGPPPPPPPPPPSCKLLRHTASCKKVRKRKLKSFVRGPSLVASFTGPQLQEMSDTP